MDRQERLALRCVAVGIAIGVLHGCATVALAFYAGLGMDPELAWFTLHVFAQPGTGVATVLGIPDETATAAFISVNLVAWSVLGAGGTFAVSVTRRGRGSGRNAT